jgi:DNA-binding LacI/PurR family transcriptional regulator
MGSDGDEESVKSRVFLGGPPHSAVAQPSYELGSTAAHILLKRISGQLTTPLQRTVLKTELIVRESSNWKPGVNS